jgi:hypothetical protein
MNQVNKKTRTIAKKTLDRKKGENIIASKSYSGYLERSAALMSIWTLAFERQSLLCACNGTIFL